MYTPMARGFVYLVTVINWASRSPWRANLPPISASRRCAKQSQVRRRSSPPTTAASSPAATSSECYASTASRPVCAASAAGAPTCLSNGLSQTIKFEQVSWYAYAIVAEDCSALTASLEFYNRRRPNCALDGRPLVAMYYNYSSLPRNQTAQTAELRLAVRIPKTCPTTSRLASLRRP